jgi:hypothetical protein
MWRLLFLLPAFSALAADPFVVHEWGTFTSFQDQEGDSLYGLQRGDEPLPNFVYLRNPTSPQEPSRSIDGCRRNSYSCDYAPEYYIAEPVGRYRLGVNQRMETPVIYFHSDVARDVNVSVRFPQGIITEWYPRAAGFQPAIGRVQGISNGYMNWRVRLHTERLPLPPVPSGSIWEPSRQVNANDVSANGENERHIFYRGVGDFETSFRALSGPASFTLTNRDPSEEVPEVIYLRVTEQGGFVRSLGRLGRGGTFELPYRDSSQQAVRPMGAYLGEASNTVHRALVNAGLYNDEAWAMVNTWRHAYFETQGERFLYVLPRTWTNNLLPLNVTPAPDRMERVLVGRVEVMNLPAQQQLFDRLFAAAQNGPIFTDGMGPFAEQHLALALNLLGARREAALGLTEHELERQAVRRQFERVRSELGQAITRMQAR